MRRRGKYPRKICFQPTHINFCIYWVLIKLAIDKSLLNYRVILTTLTKFRNSQKK